MSDLKILPSFDETRHVCMTGFEDRKNEKKWQRMNQIMSSFQRKEYFFDNRESVCEVPSLCSS
jgi:predicted transcriptional regulator